MKLKNENNPFQSNFTINLKGELMDLSTPKVMGILNLTPDSFYDGGQHQGKDAYLFQVERMLSEGVDIIDIGAASTKPNANAVEENEERQRLIPALKKIIFRFPEAKISIDTYRSLIAAEALDEGAVMINDITAGQFDDNMFSTIAERNCPYVLMHMQGEPKNMQENPRYKDVVKEVFSFFTEKIEALHILGVKDILLDMGFGFGKNLDHNYQLLNELDHFAHLRYPILVGLSRKSMIQKVLNTSAYSSINGTTAAHSVALMKGAKILRVHDVLEAKQAIDIVGMCQKQ